MAIVETHTPGTYTPRAGLYECDCTVRHLWQIDLAGHLFPPFPPDCSAGNWRETEAGSMPSPAPDSGSQA